MANAFMIHGALREPLPSATGIFVSLLDICLILIGAKDPQKIATRALHIPHVVSTCVRRDRRMPSMALFWWNPAQLLPLEPYTPHTTLLTGKCIRQLRIARQ